LRLRAGCVGTERAKKGLPMRYVIEDCRALSSQQLCTALNAAFADYVVPMKVSIDQFDTFRRQRGFSAAQSFVALADREIAAFWFSGRPGPENGHRAYTLSVGTLPEHRRKGLSRRLLSALLDAQFEQKATGIQLEVITTNHAAIDTYESLGFRRHRTLRVLKLVAEPPSRTQPHRVLPVALEDLPEQDAGFFDTAPTPQNSRAALRALNPEFHLLGVKKNGHVLGWGAAYRDGSVAQIAVKDTARRQGIGCAILRALWRVTAQEALTFVNIDSSARDLNVFLERAGAEEQLRQYEMRLDLI